MWGPICHCGFTGGRHHIVTHIAGSRAGTKVVSYRRTVGWFAFLVPGCMTEESYSVYRAQLPLKEHAPPKTYYLKDLCVFYIICFSLYEATKHIP